MNNKIRELAEQAGFFPVPDSTEWDWEFRAENARYERFAELIVKECIMLCEEWIDIDKDLKKTWVGVNPEIGPEFCIGSIKNHFGVE